MTFSYNPLIVETSVTDELNVEGHGITIELARTDDGSVLVSCKASGTGTISCSDHGVAPPTLAHGASLICRVYSGTVLWPSPHVGTYKCSAGEGALLGQVSPAARTLLILTALPNDVPDVDPDIGFRDAVVADAPWGYWRLGEASGIVAADASGNGRNATYVGGPTHGVGGALVGDADPAVGFDGVDDHVAPGALLNTGTVSVEAWVKIGAAPSGNKLLAGFANGLGSPVTDKRLIVTSERHLVWHVWDGGNRYAYTGPGALPLNEWTHVVGTADGSTAKLYVNGVEAMSVPAGPTFAAYTLPNVFIAGRDSHFESPTGHLAAEIDEVAVYNSALNADRVLAHYAAGAGGVPLDGPEVDQTWSNDQGEFSLAVPPREDLIALANENGGYLNLSLVAIQDGNPGRVGYHHLFARLSDGRFESPPPTAVQTSSTNDFVSIIPGESPCYTSNRVVATTTANTKVGELHTWDDMTGEWTYGKTADSEIEVGVKGGSGDFQGSGFIAVRNSLSNAVWATESVRFGKQWKTNMKYVTERTKTTCGFWSSDPTYKIRATEWLAGLVDGMDVSGGDGPAAAEQNIAHRSCWTQSSVDKGFEKISGKGYLYSAAASVGGFSARATSGYSTNLKTKWTFGSSKDYYFLFGTEAHPTTARVAYASSGSGSLPPDCV